MVVTLLQLLRNSQRDPLIYRLVTPQGRRIVKIVIVGFVGFIGSLSGLLIIDLQHHLNELQALHPSLVSNDHFISLKTELSIWVGGAIGLTLLISIGYSITLMLISSRANSFLEDQQKQLEKRVSERAAALEDSQRLLRQVIDNVPAPIFMKNRLGRYEVVNREYELVVGIKEREILGKADNDFLPEQIAEPLMRIDQHILASQERKILEEVVPNPQGEPRIYQSYKTPVIDPNTGESISLVGVAMDITVRKSLEQDLVDAKLAADQASVAKSEFLASISHEIRTPLNGVMGMLSLARRENTNALLEDHLRLAQESAEALLYIINDLLDFTKMEAGKVVLEHFDFDIHSLFGDVAKTLSFRADEKGLELILDLSKMPQDVVRADPTRLRQILMNLVNNAIKFTKAGQIVLEASIVEKADSLMLSASVKDTGIGISESTLHRLFQPFSQADASTNREFGGTGLGLAICKRLVSQMGGEIGVNSKLGEGSTFWFRIPIEHASEQPKELPDSTLRGIKVLIVDDVEVNRKIFTSLMEGWHIDCAETPSPHEAFELLTGTSVPFDVALLDMNMPKETGVDLAKRIRADARLQGVKLLLMTSTTDTLSSNELFEIGFDGYFSKPVTPTDLYDALLVVTELGDELREQHTLVTQQYLKSLSRKDTSDSSELESLVAGMHILLVEDNQINQLVIQGLLQNYDAKVTTVDNGADAIEFLAAGRQDRNIDLVFMDCQMPVLDGYTATENIRAGLAGEANSTLPIVAMTAHALQSDRDKCFACGMNDFLTKPIDELELQRVLRRFANNSATKNSIGQADILAPPPMVDPVILWPSHLHQINPDNPPAFSKMKKPYLSAMDAFLRQTESLGHEVQALFADHQWSSLARTAHGLKSSSGNLGFLSLSQACASIEETVRAEDSCSAVQLADLIHWLDSARIDAEAIVRRNAVIEKPAEGSWSMWSHRIAERLAKSEAIDTDELESFEQVLNSVASAEQTKELMSYLNDFDYDEALELLNQLRKEDAQS